MRRQPPIKGAPRLATSSWLIARLHDRLATIADRENVSRSWVVAVLLADALGVEEQELFTKRDFLRYRPRRAA